MRVPTGGKVREPRKRPIRCDSGTDSIVWMREEIVWRPQEAAPFHDEDLCPGWIQDIRGLLLSEEVLRQDFLHRKDTHDSSVR